LDHSLKIWAKVCVDDLTLEAVLKIAEEVRSPEFSCAPLPLEANRSKTRPGETTAGSDLEA
jgi:hypothetical protein